MDVIILIIIKYLYSALPAREHSALQININIIYNDNNTKKNIYTKTHKKEKISIWEKDEFSADA